jgi:hypothetical protein
MIKMNDPRETGRAAVQRSVPESLWKQNLAFTDEIKQIIQKHRLYRHPVAGLLETEELNKETTRVLHLEFAYAFAQIFTDSLVHAMAQTSVLEKSLGPLGKVSSRFLLQLNLLDELGFAPNEEITGQYWGNPDLAHYMQFAKTLKQLGAQPEDIFSYKPTAAAKASRKTFTDYYADYVLLTCVLACAETVFSLFAGPWAKSVGRSTDINVKEGYHAIHVEDDHGEFIDDEHSEDSWYIFRQAVTPERYDEVRVKVKQWLDVWNDFGDSVMHLARSISKK